MSRQSVPLIVAVAALALLPTAAIAAAVVTIPPPVVVKNPPVVINNIIVVPGDDPVHGVPVVTDQSLVGEEHQLNGTDYINTITLPVDGDTAQGDPDGMNESEGDDNVQENKSLTVPPDAESILRQNLTGNNFNTDPADGPNPIMHNSVDFSLTATGDITQDVLVNAAAGAFNLQANSSVLAVSIGILGDAKADVGQDSLQNSSVLQGATNEVMSFIDLENVTANIGINLVSGVGNEQINTFTVTNSFPAP